MKSGEIKISRFNEGLTVFKPDYYLNRGKKIISDILDKGVDNTTLLDVAEKLYQGGIFKRVFVENDENAYKYVTASDMVKSQPLETAKRISKKYTPWIDEMKLRDKQILMSCAGTVGNTTLVNDSFSNCIGSQEIIRIETTKVPYGYLYAYLSTTYVNQYIQSMIYGAVVPRISPAELGRLPILLAANGLQIEIHNLILEASKLRVEANRLLRESQKEIIESIDFNLKKYNEQNVTCSSISTSHLKRFEAQFFKSEGSKIINHIEANFKFEYLNNVSEPIFRPGIFKRHYVNEGIEFLGGSDIVKAIPASEKKLSKSKTSHLDAMIIKENWILVTCGGTIGYSVLVDRMTAGKAASQHILRVIPKGMPTGYIYAFMSSTIGLKAIQSFTYGSVIPQIEPHHLELLPIPVLDEEVMNSIHQKVMKYKENIGNAIEKELKAIDLIEKEIESWQKS